MHSLFSRLDLICGSVELIPWKFKIRSVQLRIKTLPLITSNFPQELFKISHHFTRFDDSQAFDNSNRIEFSPLMTSNSINPSINHIFKTRNSVHSLLDYTPIFLQFFYAVCLDNVGFFTICFFNVHLYRFSFFFGEVRGFG